MDKPRLCKMRCSDWWICEGGYTAYAPTPEKAYAAWLDKETAEPYHIYTKRVMQETLDRVRERVKERPEMFRQKIYSKVSTEPSPPEGRVVFEHSHHEDYAKGGLFKEILKILKVV
jgi:hypothetical protein